MSAIPDTRRPGPPEALLLHDVLGQTASRWPDHVAVDVPPGRNRPQRTLTTYRELAARASALAAALAPHVNGECVVAILLERDAVDLYVAQIAVLEAGAAYVCLDPAFPPERMRDMLGDAEVQVLLSNAAGAARAARQQFAPAVVIDVAASAAVPPAARPPASPWLAPASLAYLIYTSGTTGRPKGVMIEHRSVANLVAADVAAFSLTPEDRVAQNSSAAYDSSVEEIWLAFAAGATLVVMDEETVRLGPDLVDWLRRERITVFCPPPTLLRVMGADDPQTTLPDLRMVYVGGEALPPDVADRWCRGRLLVNGYGPTECTVTCTRERVEPGDPIGIGWPVRGAQAWVLDEHLAPVPDGKEGELCIGGMGLARGYWRRPELTADRFPHVPGLGRVYRTGDLASRDASGRLFYHGRIDGQVKIRGYRVELGEIEVHLARCAGVRAAACTLQGEEGVPQLVAFLVAQDAGCPPSFDEVRATLHRALPEYMVPARFAVIDALPTSLGGKLDRRRLPRLEGQERSPDRLGVAPSTPMEVRLQAALADVFADADALSVRDDFFDDLGGDSLRAAQWVTRLRDDEETAWVTVRDVYETRTVVELARRAPMPPLAGAETPLPAARPALSDSSATADAPARYPRLVTLAQACWLLLEAVVAALVAWWVTVDGLVWLVDRIGLESFLLLAPVLALVTFAVYTPCAVLFTVLVKWLVLGRYRPMRVPVWSATYLRHWIVQHVARHIPWRSLDGTVFQHAVLRALGARIGARVHIHRGVALSQGGWDLLTIGDDVTIAQDAAVRLVELEEGALVIGPVSLGDGATLDVRAGVGPDTALGVRASLTALSSLPAGGRIPDGQAWHGIPAAPAGQTPAPPALTDAAAVLSPELHGLVTVAAQALLDVVLALPAQALALLGVLGAHLLGVVTWSRGDERVTTGGWFLLALVTCASAPVTLAWAALVMRGLGDVRAGSTSRWSLGYVRVWLKTGLLARAGTWLAGTLFWPAWLRVAGMRVGQGCEISTIIDVVPELVDIGPATFFADGIYLGGPRVQEGVVTLAPVSLGPNTFLGNHAVVAAGQSLPGDILIGVCTAADAARVRPRSSWFGHPPFELPRREVVTVDRSLTHEPGAMRYCNRVLWELARFALPLMPLVLLVAWYDRLAVRGGSPRSWAFLLIEVPLVTIALTGAPVAGVVLMKWALLWRVRPGQHPLWSCWCSRWDFLYVAWAAHARPLLRGFEGTLLLSWFLRAMGMRIGRRVVLGPGFAQVVDPDMITIEDEATVHAAFQAHTFEDRVLKIDRVRVGRGATLGSNTVPLYGAVIGEGTHVAAHSVVMKRERLLPGVRYEGCPTRPEPQVRASVDAVVAPVADA